MVIALGVTWISTDLRRSHLQQRLAGALKDSPNLQIFEYGYQLCKQELILPAQRLVQFFLAGWLTDRLGRKELFSWTLAVYLTATAATAAS